MINDYIDLELVIAGGTAPYTCEIVDLPGVNDGQPPQGVILSEQACAFVGSAAEPGIFLMSLRVTDAVGGEAFFTGQMHVTTPPIVLATEYLDNGKCGTTYSTGVTIVDGVPPFLHQFVASAVNRLPDPDPDAPPGATIPDVTWDSTGQTPPVVNPPTALDMIDATIYPPENEDVAGTFDYRTAYDGAPPEGIYLRDDSGAITGRPRRMGDFRVHYHVMSTLFSNIEGQQAWADYDIHMDQSEPPTAPDPAFAQDPAYTVEGAFSATKPYATLPQAEVGVSWNPDGDSRPGVTILAHGGVAKDGKTDGPHESQVMDIEGYGAGQEALDRYHYAVDYDPDGDGPRPANVPPPEFDFNTDLGEFYISGSPTNLVRQGFQEIAFTVTDEQLPTTVQHAETQKVRFTVGPDLVVVTESTTSSTGSYSGYYYGPYDYNDYNMKLRIVEPRASSPSIRDLNAGTNNDMVASHSVPGGAGSVDLQTLLSGFDILRCSVNPCTWHDDAFSLNAGGARAAMHADPNRYVNYYTMYYYYPMMSSVQAVHIPDCTAPETGPGAVVHDPLGAGVYRDGGQMYVFESSSYLGVFIVREDSKIYVPAAFNKGSSGFYSFGDGVHNPLGSYNSVTRVATFAASPDGRFGAMKLIQTSGSEYAYQQPAYSTKILLFSLTGEQVFDGGTSTYKVIDTGSTATSTYQGGRYMYANSMVFTNKYLYYLCGDNVGKRASWQAHYIYRYELEGGQPGGALLHPGFSSNWTNTTSSPMQTAFQIYDGTAYKYSYGFTDTSRADQDQYLYDGSNVAENGLAPVPFRASADGSAVAILAGVNSTSTYSSAVMSQNVWVDYDGSLYQLSTTARHCQHGAGRIGSLARGPSGYFHWGARTGPSGAFEISDDGLKVAVVVSRSGTINGGGGQYDDSDSNWTEREDVIAYEPSSGSSWASGASEIQVTGADSGSTMVFDSSPTPFRWRFGSLVFTRDGNGLVFWGGYSAKNPTGTHLSWYQNYPYSGSWQSYSYMWENAANEYFGTLYSYNFSNGEVRSLLPGSAGGGADGEKTYSTSTQVSPSTSGSFNGNQGNIRPAGAFVSMNGDFLYMVSNSPLSGSNATQNTLVGVNIRSLDGQTNSSIAINNHPDGKGFAVGNWPTRRGFLPCYYYYGYYWLMDARFYAPGHWQGFSEQVMSKESGRVFFSSHYQVSGPTSVTSSSTFADGPTHPTYWQDYASYGGHIEMIDANVGGPVQRLTDSSLGSDTSYRPIVYVEPSKSGNAVAYVRSANSSVHYQYYEQVGYVGHIETDASGNLTSSKFSTTITTSQGRAGEAMAHDSTGERLYYAFHSGTGGNENQKQVYEATFDASGSPTTRSVASTQKRYNVLHSGR